jgi:hypothetical protein
MQRRCHRLQPLVTVCKFLACLARLKLPLAKDNFP